MHREHSEDRDIEEGLLSSGRNSTWHCCCDGECVVRSCLHLGFFCCLIGAWLVALTPWALALTEDGVMLLLYGLLIPDALFVRKSWATYHYSASGSLEDVLVFSLLRCLAVFSAYGVTCGQQNSRPYRVTAHALGWVGLLFVGIKAVIMRRQPSVVPRLVLLLTSGAFSALHIVCAEGMERVLQIRAKYPAAPEEDGAQTSTVEADEDEVAAWRLADDDSCFVECGPVTVHYKIARPQGFADESGETVVILHGFGGGVFAWRYVLQPLADAIGRPVLAFDRPAFGLTSRPLPSNGASNPYTLKSQARLVGQLCGALGLMHVVLVGHSDGAPLALMAAADMKKGALPPPSRATSPSHPGTENGRSGVEHPQQPSNAAASPEVMAVALVQPCFSGRLGRDLTRYKGWKGVANLRRTLRSHLVDLIIRSAWADPADFTPSVKRMYEAPFYIRDWDNALLMFCEQERQLSLQDLRQLCEVLRTTRSVLVRGSCDGVASDQVDYQVAGLLKCRVVELDCGHFSNEEVPLDLVQSLASFISGSEYS